MAAMLVAAVLLASGCGVTGGSGGYTVRAIFDDAANIIPGENVKIEGVKVGTVGPVTATPQQKAAVVLNIEDPGFQDFRADASCTIEPEALIGEKFVNCLPTQPRAEGTPLPPPLHRIPGGQEGEGQYLLGVQNNSSPVDVDLLGDINRLPVRERFTIILNELGAGLAGRGSDLNAVIRRADPALRELDKVVGILAHQNKLLAKLAVDSNQALAPIPAVKEQISGFIAGQDTVARATANQRGALKQNLADFPPFLEQLGPAMERYGRLAEQTTPAFTDLKAAAPGINQTFTQLPAFQRSSTTFFTEPRQDRKALGARARGAAAAAGARKDPGERRQAVQLEPLRTVHEPARHRRARAADGLHLPRRGLDERLRRARALPARRTGRQRLPHLRVSPRFRGAAPNCSARTASPRRKAVAAKAAPARARPRAAPVRPGPARRAW